MDGIGNENRVVRAILLFLAMVLLLALCSCRTTKETYKASHFEATALKAEKADLTYKIITEWSNGYRHIKVYDTSKAERTTDGFVSPLLADIEVKDTTTMVVEVTDSTRLVVDAENVADNKEEDKTKETTRKGEMTGFFMIFFIVFFVWLVIRKKNVFHV